MLKFLRMLDLKYLKTKRFLKDLEKLYNFKYKLRKTEKKYRILGRINRIFKLSAIFKGLKTTALSVYALVLKCQKIVI